MNQMQMFWQSHENAAALNRAFMDLVNDPVNPLTNADLEKLIGRRPEIYGRFSGYIGKLKN